MNCLWEWKQANPPNFCWKPCIWEWHDRIFLRKFPKNQRKSEKSLLRNRRFCTGTAEKLVNGVIPFLFAEQKLLTPFRCDAQVFWPGFRPLKRLHLLTRLRKLSCCAAQPQSMTPMVAQFQGLEAMFTTKFSLHNVQHLFSVVQTEPLAWMKWFCESFYGERYLNCCRETRGGFYFIIVQLESEHWSSTWILRKDANCHTVFQFRFRDFELE